MKRWITPVFDDVPTAKTRKNAKIPSAAKRHDENTSTNSLENGVETKLNGTGTKAEYATALKNFNYERYIAPKQKSELAVHAKKVQEVENWLCDRVLNRLTAENAPMLLLTGPTGSAKTTTLKILCKTHEIETIEWVTPLDYDYELHKGPGQTARLLEFLMESKYPSLTSAPRNALKLILIKDFPNSVILNPADFHAILERCHCLQTIALAFICTDTSGSSINIAQGLFPEEITTKYNISRINFNACSATVLKNALKRVQSLMAKKISDFKLPSELTIESIIVSCSGDVRSAMNQYYFACLKGLGELPTENLNVNGSSAANKTAKGKRKRTGKNAMKISSMSRDETLGLFHSIGRVMNPKRRVANDEANVSDCRLDEKLNYANWRLDCDVTALVDEFVSQPMSVEGFLHENYLAYFGDVDDACKAVDCLSLGQVFSRQWSSEKQESVELGLWTCILGLMVHNEHRVTSWHPIKGPVKIKKEPRTQLNTLDLPSVDRCYYNLITKNKTDFPYV